MEKTGSVHLCYKLMERTVALFKIEKSNHKIPEFEAYLHYKDNGVKGLSYNMAVPNA